MGGMRKAIITDRCPWSIVFAEPVIGRLLSAYGLIERWGEWPPGKRDPRVLEALSVISSEYSRIDNESLEAAKDRGK